MNNKGFIRRALPFFATFAVGIFIASFFVTIGGSGSQGHCHKKKRGEVRRLNLENEQLRFENERLRSEMNRLSGRHLPEPDDLELNELPPIPPMPVAPNAPRAPHSK